MATVLEFVRQLASEKFKEAAELSLKSDPEHEPYNSKYKAREILTELIKLVEEKRSDDSSEYLWIVLGAVLHLKLGKNYVETEELPTGEEYLEKCIKSISDLRLDMKACNILHNALNQMGILWATRGTPETALRYLEQAETLYSDFKHQIGNAPYTESELFNEPGSETEAERVQKRTDNFEGTYTHTLYYMAQVYANLGDNMKSARYCHDTLRRQLDTMKYEPIDWSLNAATLSQFYITQDKYHMARHCLASAEFILKEMGNPPQSLHVIPLDTEDQASLNSREKIPKVWADLYRCWAKYALALLEESKEKLYKENEDENIDATKAEMEDDKPKNPSEDGENYFNLELTAVENQITDRFLLVFGDARLVFLQGQKWLDAAKEFYVLDGHCTDYVEIIQDHSRLYQRLAFFEMDFERQAKMHKRRIDMLQGLLKELSLQYYLLVCRQLMYEIAETYSTMLDTKLALIEASEDPPSARAVRKINHLSRESITMFETYLNTFLTPEKKMPAQFCDDDERPALVAYFCLGRLHSKFIEFDVEKRIKHMGNSLNCYKVLVDYCKLNPTAEEKISAERSICEELVTLIPAKMDRVRAQALSD